MSLTSPSPRRTMPVRLCDIRIEVRAEAAHRAARSFNGDAAELIVAAVAPSTRTYYVSAEAADQVKAICS